MLENWEWIPCVITLSSLYRTQQLEERQAATKKYGTASTDTNYWLDTTERKVKQLQPVSMDKQTIQIQLREVQVGMGRFKTITSIPWIEST